MQLLARAPSPFTAQCRVCGTRLPAAPALTLRNMPGAAQNLPDADTLANDRGCDLHLHECDACGLVQIPGEPVPYYKEVIRAAAFSSDMRAFRAAQLARWVESHGLQGQRILEVGCGKGEYLELLSACGVQATGLEYAQASVAHCRRAGLDVLRGFPTRAGGALPAESFAAFMTLNFMEHWPRPVETLRAIRDSLVPGGIGLVEVPNFDMVLQERLYSEFISDHLSYFTRDSFAFALHRAGFEVLSMDSVWHDYILSAVVRKRGPTDLSALTRHGATVTQALRSFVGRFPPRTVAVWGAGHQALAVLALAELGSDIRYVVDSAPFKQGRFTPATHIPIVAPDHLAADPVEAVIVMAAAYSDEVARLIRERHGLGVPVAILRAHGLELA